MIFFRKLTGFKYQLLKRYALATGIRPKRAIKTPFLALSKRGVLIIKKGYAWDGPSGPTIDTPSFMRGSLVHDCLYQFIRMGRLDMSKRDAADKLLRKLCLESGMPRWRAWYVYRALKWFGESNARPRAEPEIELLKAP